jgi:hypothetical protein
VEKTKLTSKRRNGVAPFIKSFPVYIARVETQLIGSDGLEIRSNVDAAYETLVQTMFDSLKQMAKMDGEGEDKGQLNYHVILIGNSIIIDPDWCADGLYTENMHHFLTETSQLEIGSVVGFLNTAEGIYEENLNGYVKIVLRRPFAKIIVLHFRYSTTHCLRPSRIISRVSSAFSKQLRLPKLQRMLATTR